ncbi:DNA replication and repair protein RecF [Candidatus Saccharibacteria bacterium]|nr:DNA replication and repair protein RecF [Candidatus Saccharibacteria bacterium]
MLSSISLQHFRSYDDASFEFGEGVNIIVGPNGSGKTNLLEALLVIAQGMSYRVSDADLLYFGAEWARLDAYIGDAVRTVKLRAGMPAKKSFEIDGKQHARLPLIKQLPTVLFEPNHLLILQGNPEGRRTYLDDILEQTKPGYASFRRNFKRVLAQRNALLKHQRAGSQDFFPWDLRLSELGAVIHRSRAELVERLNKDIGSLYHGLSHNKTDISVRYESRFSTEDYESQLLRLLEANLSKDLVRGFTSYGPHREDMQIYFGDTPIHLLASRGEVRTATLVLKVLELLEIETATNTKPILLLDDVFSELDGTRRRALTTYLSAYQTFLTTTDADIVVKHFTNSSIIPLSTGSTQ